MPTTAYKPDAAAGAGAARGWQRRRMATVLAVVATAAAALGLAACGKWSNAPAAAALQPGQPLTLVVTFPPGGGTDWLARQLAPGLSARLGVPVVVDNRPGASGNIGAAVVAQAAPDGHTLLMANTSYAINPGVFRALEFDPARDLVGVANVAYAPSVVVVPASSPWRSLGDVLAQGRVGAQGQHAAASPASAAVPFASCGNGTPQHLAGELLARAAKVAWQQVPYKGCGPALTAVAGAQVPLAVVTASSATPLVQAGRLRALAVTAPQRFGLLPDVPTVAEQGFTGYAVDQWHGLLAPAGTPQPVLDLLHRALREVQATPAVDAALRAQGFAPDNSSAEAFQALVQADITRYGALTRSLGLQLD